MEKFTKRNVYTAIINYAASGQMVFDTEDGQVTVGAEELKAFAENEIALLDKKAAKAKESAAKKRAEADELQIAVQAVLTDEFAPIAEIAALIEGDDVTVSKVTYRLNALVEAGVAEKSDIKVPVEGKKSRTIKGYRLAAVDQDNVE